MMRWIGLFDGYVSADGRFLVSQVVVDGRRGPVTQWALYGVVRLEGGDGLGPSWRWSDRPLHGPVATKRACQRHAETLDYTPPQVDVSPTTPASTSTIKRLGYSVCQECGVDFPHTVNWPYEDYCGPNCTAIATERLDQIRQNLAQGSQ